MELDIRGSENTAIESIRVWGSDSAWYVAEIIEPQNTGVHVIDTDSDRYVTVLNKEHAQNLIKGLQKAIDLGWFD